MQAFLILWFGQLLSLIGSQLTGFALSVWVYQQTQSSTLFGLLLGLNVLPVILLSPLIGIVADTWNRQRVMLLSDFGAGLSTVALAIALKTQHLPISLIAVLIVVNATFSSFMRPAFTAASTQLVANQSLAQVSGLMQISQSMAQLMGPFLGGALLGSIGLPGIVWIDVSTFVIALLTQSFLRIPNLPPSQSPKTPKAWMEEATRAISFLRDHPGLIALLSFFVIKNFLTAIVYAVTTPYVLSFSSELMLGSILSVGGIGMLVGGIIFSLIPHNRCQIQTIINFCALSGVVLFALGFQKSIPLFMVGSFLFFLGLPFLHGSGQVIFQRKVPMTLQGRLFAFNEAVAGASVPLGYLAAGPLSEFIFEPSLQPNGGLANTFGPILGVGPGRGIALLLIVIGICHGALAFAIAGYRPLRRVNLDILDANDDSELEATDAPPLPRDMIDPEPVVAVAKAELVDPAAGIQSPASSLEWATAPRPQTLLSRSDSPAPAPGSSFAKSQGSRPLSPIIQIENLNYSFGKGSLAKQVLMDINLTIQPGEIVIMTGPSGSGKTTLLTLMGALRSVQDGSLSILGQELNGVSTRKLVQIRRNIGYIFQAHNLLPFLTAHQNVRMALSLHSHSNRRQALRKVDEVLQAVGLGDRMNYYPEKLSGGQKQRVAIARALVNEPALILADEPTASLDSKTGRDVVELMYRLAKEKQCTILLVTHDNRILDIADRIINLEDGKLKNAQEKSLAIAHTPMTLDLAPANSASDGLQTFTTSAIGAHSQNSAVTAGNSQYTVAHTEERLPIPPQPDNLPQPKKTAKCYTIACIDDSPTILYSLKAFLSDSLFSVALIQDPIQALVQLILINPDMVILDINMPQLDGYQLCTLLRDHEKFKHIPVIVISGDPQALQPELLKKAGFTDYLTKPFDRADLMIKLFPYLN